MSYNEQDTDIKQMTGLHSIRVSNVLPDGHRDENPIYKYLHLEPNSCHIKCFFCKALIC